MARQPSKPKTAAADPAPVVPEEPEVEQGDDLRLDDENNTDSTPDDADVDQEDPFTAQEGPSEPSEQPGVGLTPRNTSAHREAAPAGLILGPDEPVRITGDVTDDGVFVIVDQDIFRETYPIGSARPSYIQVYAKGSRVPVSKLTSLS